MKKKNSYVIRLKNKDLRRVSSETFGQQGMMVLFYDRGKDHSPSNIFYAVNVDEVLDIELVD